MNADHSIKSFPIVNCAVEAWQYIQQNLKVFTAFVGANFLLLMIGFKLLGGMGSIWFVFWCVFYYWFNCFFFRFYFDRKPYWLTRKVFDSLVPSTKILFLTLALATFLAYLPFLPLFFGLPVDVLDEYAVGFIQQYIDENNIYDFTIQVILLFISPLIFYRPLFAWISSVIGRSGSLRNAWRRTKGNYWRFWLVALVCNLAVFGLEFLDEICLLNGWGELVIGSVLIMFVNVYIAKSYDFFFLEVDTE